MSKYDIKDDLVEKNQRIINVVDLLLSLDSKEINYYLKKRILYLLNPEFNEYIEYIPLKKRGEKNDFKRKNKR